MSSSQNHQKGNVYSPLPQSESDPSHDVLQDHPLATIPVETTRLTTSDDNDSSDHQTGDYEKSDVEPQNVKDRDHKFSPLPQSEPDHDHPSHPDRDREHHLPLSISVESTRPTADSDSDGAPDHVSTGNTEMIQDLIGLTILLMLILSPLYRRMGSPSEDPIPPVLTLNSMYISNFTTSDGSLTATWDAKMTVTNVNVSCMYFRSTDFTIFYKQNPEDAVSVASLYPFYLDRGESLKLHLKFTAGPGAWDEGQPCVEKWLVEQMGEDKAKEEALTFGMQMNAEAIYYGDTWVSDVDMSPHCEGLKMQFAPNQGSGRLTHPNRNFSVPIGWKPFTLF